MTTTSTTILPRLTGATGGLSLALVSLALVTACPAAPAETMTDSDASTSSTSTTGTSNQTMTVTITTASGTETTMGTTVGTTMDPTGSPTSETGDPVCAESDEFSCAGAFECGDSCGGLGSRFDDDGCLRPSCSSDGDCDGGEVCYGANWGRCTSSQYSCEDASGSCECDSSDDCGGNYCVPASALPEAVTSPVGLRFANDCAPDDGPAVKLEIGLGDDPEFCKGGFGDPWLRLSIPGIGAPLAPGAYPVTQGNHSTGDALGGGWLMIDSWEGEMVSGSYAVIFGDGLYEGSFANVVFCSEAVQCG